MIQITMFSTDANCNKLGSAMASHIIMFEKDMRITLNFIEFKEQLKFIELCVENYILVQIQGKHVSIIPENNNYQRVRFRFDAQMPSPSVGIS